MRRLVPLVIALFSLANAFSASMSLDVEKEKKSFGTKITISPMDKTVTVTKNKIGFRKRHLHDFRLLQRSDCEQD